MQKIPTLFFRSGLDLSLVTNTINPECAWVVANEGVATISFDGVPCVIKGGALYEEFGQIAIDLTTPGNKHYREAWERRLGPDGVTNLVGGTYALVGPEVHGNPYGLEDHQLWPHGVTFREYSPDFDIEPPRDYNSLVEWFGIWEGVWGILWSHPDGRIARITRQDLGLAWPSRKE